jgi:hypothetical protein
MSFPKKTNSFVIWIKNWVHVMQISLSAYQVFFVSMFVHLPLRVNNIGNVIWIFLLFSDTIIFGFTEFSDFFWCVNGNFCECWILDFRWKSLDWMISFVRCNRSFIKKYYPDFIFFPERTVKNMLKSRDSEF